MKPRPSLAGFFVARVATRPGAFPLTQTGHLFNLPRSP
jgi:hypothetical protein